MRYQTGVALGLLTLAIVGVAVAWVFLRRRSPTRFAAVRLVHSDPEIAEWFVAFDWTPKVLYLPAIIASLAAAAAMIVVRYVSNAPRIPGAVVGGIWLAVVAFNVLVEEARFGWRGLAVFTGAVGLAVAWLHFAGWLRPLIKLASDLQVNPGAGVYLAAAALGLAAILASWVRGLFLFAVVTPKFVLVGQGIGRSAARIDYKDVEVSVDRSDLLKRLIDFGRVSIEFADRERAPLVMLVGRAGAKAAMLKAIRRQVDREASVVPARVVEEPPKP